MAILANVGTAFAILSDFYGERVKVFNVRSGFKMSALRACAASAVFAVTSVASNAAQPAETAMATSDFIDTIGINTHFQYDKPYRNNAAAVASLLGDSGIRHIRDGAMPFTDKTYISILGTLHARGIKIDLLTDERMKLDWVIKQSEVIPPGMIDSYENPNELDLSRSGDYFIDALHSFTPALYRAVKSDPRTSSLPVIGPSLTTQRAYDAVSDLSAYIDYGNIHNYVFPRPPGTESWGLSHYGSISSVMRAARSVAGSKPIMTTEAGWGTSSKPADVSEAVQLKYLQRFLFEQALHGIKRSYIYQFLDAGTSFNTFGLVHGDLSPKPSYTGIRNLIKMLSDSGPPRRDEVHVSVDGPATVHHMLLEKSDGRRYLAIWNEIPSVDSPGASAGNHAFTSKPLTTHVMLDGTHVDVYGFDETGTLRHSTMSAQNDNLNYLVTDSISILEWQAGSN